MRIVVAGGTGFLGRPLCAALAASGHDVAVLSRGGSPAAPTPWTDRPGTRTLWWSGEASTEGWAHVIDAADAVINLAGESIAGSRWTAAKKARLEQSRVLPTRALVQAIGDASTPPRLLIGGSAVGYYGPRGDERLTEASAPGRDFLAKLAIGWEAESARAQSPRTRVILLRTGVVLEGDGGALQKMLFPFRLGLGGPLGPGTQFMPWIHRRDWVSLVEWLLASDHDGPFNATAPEPVTNAAFTAALGAALRRPAFLRAPAVVLRAVMGEMADALLLQGQRAVPERALELGFQFEYPRLEDALAAILR